MVVCDKCNKKFKIDAKVKKHNKGIEEVYFRCEHCKKKYVSCFTDKDIKEQQKEIRAKYNELNKSEDKDSIQREIDEMKKMLSIDMDNLKNKMIGTQ